MREDVLRAVEARGGRPGDPGVRGRRSEIISRDLERHYLLLARALRTVELTQVEALLVAEACKDWALPAQSTLWLLWNQVDDAIRLKGLDRKHGVDGQTLVNKIQDWSDLQVMAVVDAAERFWVNPSRGGGWLRECFGVREQGDGEEGTWGELLDDLEAVLGDLEMLPPESRLIVSSEPVRRLRAVLERFKPEKEAH